MSNTNNPQPRPPHPEDLRRLATSAELRQVIPVGRTRFYQTTRRPDFPEPIRLTPGGDYRWFLDEVYAWLEEQRVGKAERRRAPKRPRPDSPEVPPDEEPVQFRVVSQRERRDAQPARELPDVDFRNVASDRERVA